MTEVPRFWRMYFELWLIRRWRLPATPALTLPVAVNLKRFLAPDFVCSFGIFTLCLLEGYRSSSYLSPTSASLIEDRPGMPVRPAVRYAKARLLRQELRRGKKSPRQPCHARAERRRTARPALIAMAAAGRVRAAP